MQQFPILNFKCPQCGRRHVRPFDQTVGGVTSSYGVGHTSVRYGVTNVVNVQMWKCEECGHTFRDVNQWHEQNENALQNLYKPKHVLFRIFLCYVAGAFPYLFLVFAGDEDFLAFVTILYLAFTFLGAFGLLQLEKKNLLAQKEQIMELAPLVDAGNMLEDTDETCESEVLPERRVSNEEYKFCSTCGNKIKKSASFCDRCGNPTN